MSYILDIMHEIKNNHPLVKQFEDYGCYTIGSSILSQRLNDCNIDHEIIIGYGLLCDTAYKIKSELFSIKNKKVSKRSSKIKRKDIYHTAIYKDGIVYDVSGKQFGLKDTYFINTFCNMWEKKGYGIIQSISEVDEEKKSLPYLIQRPLNCITIPNFLKQV